MCAIMVMSTVHQLFDLFPTFILLPDSKSHTDLLSLNLMDIKYDFVHVLHVYDVWCTCVYE